MISKAGLLWRKFLAVPDQSYARRGLASSHRLSNVRSCWPLIDVGMYHAPNFIVEDFSTGMFFVAQSREPIQCLLEISCVGGITSFIVSKFFEFLYPFAA